MRAEIQEAIDETRKRIETINILFANRTLTLVEAYEIKNRIINNVLDDIEEEIQE